MNVRPNLHLGDVDRQPYGRGQQRRRWGRLGSNTDRRHEKDAERCNAAERKQGFRHVAPGSKD